MSQYTVIYLDGVGGIKRVRYYAKNHDHLASILRYYRRTEPIKEIYVESEVQRASERAGDINKIIRKIK